MTVYISARRCNDPWDPRWGKLLLSGFSFHRGKPQVDWGSGEVAVSFTSWAEAQQAVKAFRKGDPSLWDANCQRP